METTVSQRRLILQSFQSPGDIVMLTAAIRDLHAAAPGRFLTDIRTSADALFENNPHVTRLSEGDSGVESLDMHYPLVPQSNQRPYHFIHGYAQFLEERLGLQIPVTRFAGDIHLSDVEKRLPPPGNELGIPEHFWIIIAGGKHDFTAKWWNPASYQKVVDHFRGKIQFVQCGEAGHWHPPLDGVVNSVGKTSTREFVRLMYHSDGVVCPVTLAMHLAAAVETKPGRARVRPCVVIAGGREPAHWEAYPHHQFLSTNGALSCCQEGGCWKSRCQLVGDGDPKDHNDLCQQPVAIHYQGNTSADKKNLSPEDVKLLCQELIRAGYVPVILDWDHRSALPDQQTIFCPDADTPDLWHNTGTGDAERLAALISQCALMVGVDSGPLHVAGSTDTPTLACWSGHMPPQFFDLCPNVLHLLPENWRAIPPCHNPKAISYFEKNYCFETCKGFRQALVHHALRLLGPLQERPDKGLEFCSGFWVRKDNFEQDLVIVQDVYASDAYRTGLLSSNAGPQVVVDIGAHIGCFAKLWHRKNPEARTICVEACPENIPALCANVGDFAEIVQAACTYESGPLALLNSVRPNCESTGGSVVVPRSELETSSLRQAGYAYWRDVRDLPTVTLEELMQRLGFDHIDVLKLDCEGSEYSILGHTPSLDRIRIIVGEYHFHSRWEPFRHERMRGS